MGLTRKLALHRFLHYGRIPKRVDLPAVPRKPWPVRATSGFTLVELLVVISMISILAAMAVVQYRNSVQSAKEATLKTNLFRMRDAIDQYYADKGKYPSALDTLVSDGYLRQIPEDPITKSRDSWQTTPAEPDPSNPSAEPGIYDVKSGAQGTALDGSNFADW
jgi:general secretion pathway protein G